MTGANSLAKHFVSPFTQSPAVVSKCLCQSSQELAKSLVCSWAPNLVCCAARLGIAKNTKATAITALRNHGTLASKDCSRNSRLNWGKNHKPVAPAKEIAPQMPV